MIVLRCGSHAMGVCDHGAISVNDPSGLSACSNEVSPPDFWRCISFEDLGTLTTSISLVADLAVSAMALERIEFEANRQSVTLSTLGGPRRHPFLHSSILVLPP